MKYVLDSSLAFKWVVPEALSEKAIALRDEFRQGLHEFLAPDVFPIEVAHALTRAERQDRISTANGFDLWTEVMLDCPQLSSSTDLVPNAYLISSAMRLGVYDCLYIALSERESCLVVTADQRLVSRFPANTISLASL